MMHCFFPKVSIIHLIQKRTVLGTNYRDWTMAWRDCNQSFIVCEFGNSKWSNVLDLTSTKHCQPHLRQARYGKQRRWQRNAYSAPESMQIDSNGFAALNNDKRLFFLCFLPIPFRTTSSGLSDSLPPRCSLSCHWMEVKSIPKRSITVVDFWRIHSFTCVPT